MEQRINLTDLDLEDIVKRIKLLKNDPSVSTITLCVKRK